MTTSDIWKGSHVIRKRPVINATVFASLLFCSWRWWWSPRGTLTRDLSLLQRKKQAVQVIMIGVNMLTIKMKIKVSGLTSTYCKTIFVDAATNDRIHGTDMKKIENHELWVRWRKGQPTAYIRSNAIVARVKMDVKPVNMSMKSATATMIISSSKLSYTCTYWSVM